MKRYFIITFLFSIQFLIYAQPAESERSKKAIAENEPSLAGQIVSIGLELWQPVFIRIFKQEKELEVWIKDGDVYELFKTYPICYFSGPPGPKQRTGDGISPEGFYFATSSSFNPFSQFHLSINIGYPNRYDRSHGRTGSYIMIHGSCVSIGCYAMTDEGIEEIYTLAYKAITNGQRFFRIHIFPFRMTEENMTKNEGSQWYNFWLNLKVGYDWFENHRIPPNVNVQDKTYTFSVGN